MVFQPGQTALVLLAPESAPLVEPWRARFDATAVAAGVPPHVTVLYPFLPEREVDAAVHADLRALFAARAPVTVTFAEVGTFPGGVAYLTPDHGDVVRELTSAVVHRWPQAPPYGGAHPEVVPHLTVAQDASDAELEEIRAGLAVGLPVIARFAAVDLIAFDGVRWVGRARFGLGEGFRA